VKPTILCVDPDRHLCEIIGKALSGEGYAVRLAHDGETALSELSSAPVDLVLVDVLLPKRDGFSVLESLRERGAPDGETPVILTSGCSQTPEYRERAERLGASALLKKPVPLTTLLETVAKCLGGAVRVGSADAADGASRRRDSKPLSGTLQELPFPALLHHLHGLRATGVLHLTSGRRRKDVQLRDGYAVAVKSNLVNECLGNYLVRSGNISKDTMLESLKRMKKGEGLQGEILVAMKRLSESALGEALLAQAREKLFAIFAWSEGEYAFEMRGRLAGANALALEASPADVILDGVRERFAIERVDAYLETHADRYVARGESPFYRFQEIHLEPQEAAFLRGLDGSRALRDFLTADEKIRRTLYALLVTEMLELHAAPRQADGAASAADREERAKPAEPPKKSDAQLRAELLATAERMRGRDCFEVLGIARSASDRDVRAAYEELATRMHPDRYSGASEPVKRLAADVFKLVSDAYENLSDEKRRVEYCQGLQREWKPEPEPEDDQRALKAEDLFQKGEAMLRNKDYLGALGCFHQAVRLYPNEGEYHAHQGWALYLARPEELSEAIALVREGAKLAPDREKPYLFLGRLVKAQGRVEMAEKLFTRAVQIKPDCVEAIRELRLIEMRRKKGKGLISRLMRR
jgi:CheY-like chemotaxis protein/tetratricopeptide (TPR) repeat protein